MKRCLVLSTVCALAAPLLLAAPAPTQAIPGTDLLFVADRLDADIPNQARWDAIEEKYADLFDANLDDVPDDLLPLLKAAFGMTPDGEIKDVKSWTVSVTLPKTLEAFAQLDQDKWPDRLGLYCFIENPRVDLTGVNAAIEKLVTGRPGSGSQLTHKGRWTALTPLDPLEAAGMPLIAWCPIDRGFAVTLCKDYDTAEQAVGNRVAPAPKTPLAEAFKAPSAQGPWGRIVVRDVADLLDRYVTDPMERQEIMEIMPFILQMHGVVASLFYREDGTLQLAITTTTNSAAEALQAHDMLITLKVMIRQGIVPQFYGTPYADLFAGIIDSARCEAEGNAATLTLSLTPDQAEALLDFAAAIQAAPPAEDDEIPLTQNNTNNNPNPAWAVPGTEILIVADRLNQDVPNKAAWEALQKKTQALVETSGITIPEELQPLLKAAFGMTPEGKTPNLRHMTCAVTLPKTVTAFSLLDQAQWPADLGLYSFIGNPEANLDEANKAVEKLIADNLSNEIKLEKDGQWTVLTSVDPESAGADPFVGWKSIEGGFTFVVSDTQATADRAVGNTEAPAADSPLAKAFQAPSEAGPWSKIVVRDVADLLNRYITSPTDRQEVMLNVPFLFQMHAISLTTCYNPDGNMQLTLEANTESEETAVLMRDQFIALKVMARQMIVPQFTGTPYAEPFSQLADSVTCEATGTAATLTLTVTPAQAEALVDLCVAYQGALANGPSGDPFADDEPYFGAQE